VYLTGINKYAGTVIRTFIIKPIKLTAKNTSISGVPVSETFKGVHRPEPVLEYDGKILEKDEDYTVAYKNNDKAGTATITLKVINNYSGSLSKTFKITKREIPFSSIILKEKQIYVKGGVKPVPEIEVDGTKLVSGKDFTLSYKNNSSVNDGSGNKVPSVTITGKGNYSGKHSLYFVILPSDISRLEMSVSDKAYSSKAGAWRSAPVLYDENGKKLTAGTDYEKDVVYTLEGSILDKSDIVPAGSVITVTAKGKGNYEGEISNDYRIVIYDIAKASVTIGNQYYTGKPITLSKSDITVKLSKQMLDPSNYDIITYTNNVAKDTAKVTLKGKGSYGGYKTVSFKIVQRPMGITIRYHGNGATSGSMKDQIIYKNAVLNKNNYKKSVNGNERRFLGWNTKADGSGAFYDDLSLFIYDQNKAGAIIDLYARWEKNEVTKIALMLPFAGDQSYFDTLANAAREVDAADNNIIVDVFECDPNGEVAESNWMDWFDNVCEDGEYDLVVSGNGTYEGFLYQACEKYPKQKFYNYDYDEVPKTGMPKNCYAPKASIAEMGYLAGALSAAVTKTGTVGVVVGMDNQGMNQFISGYCQVLADKGVKYVISYPGSFTDTALGKEVTSSMIDKGADVIWQVAGDLGNGVIDACSEHEDVWCIGVDQDQYMQFKDFNPDWANTILTSALKNTNIAFKAVCDMVAAGTYDEKLGKAESWGIALNGVGMTENEWYFSHTTVQQRTAYQDLLNKVKNGEVEVIDCMKWDYETYAAEWPKVRDANRVD